MQDTKKQRVLITDLDGSILKSMPVAWGYFKRIAEKKGKKMKHYSEYSSTFDLYRDVTLTFWLRTLKILPRMKRYMYLHADHIPEYEKTLTALARLNTDGWKIIIVTDNDEGYARKALDFNSHGIDTSWIEIYSAETETKLNLIYKVLKKYQDEELYFASHDSKDFFLYRIASLLTGIKATLIFTPNEIDKKSNIDLQSTLADLPNNLKNK